MTEWKQQVKNALEELSETNNKIIIVAHSMGTLFAIQEAIEKPVDELFLLNVPLKVRVTFRLFRTSWRVFTGNIKLDDKWSLAAQKAYSIERDNHILRYFGWIPRYLELFSEIRKTRKIIGKLLTPSHIYLCWMKWFPLNAAKYLRITLVYVSSLCKLLGIFIIPRRISV